MKVKSKSKKINKAWLLDHLNYTYVKLSKKEGYRARAAYKLKEIDETLGLLKPGQVVVDLGASPGPREPCAGSGFGHRSAPVAWAAPGDVKRRRQAAGRRGWGQWSWPE